MFYYLPLQSSTNTSVVHSIYGLHVKTLLLRSEAMGKKSVGTGPLARNGMGQGNAMGIYSRERRVRKPAQPRRDRMVFYVRRAMLPWKAVLILGLAAA